MTPLFMTTVTLCLMTTFILLDDQVNAVYPELRNKWCSYDSTEYLCQTCGSQLTDLLQEECGEIKRFDGHKPDLETSDSDDVTTKWDSDRSKRMANLDFDTLNIRKNLLVTSLIADCCEKKCSHTLLLSYCPLL